MKNKELLEELEKTLELLNIELRYEKLLQGTGGFCILKGEKVVIIDKNISLSTKIDKLVSILKQQQLSDIYIPPVVRSLLEFGFDNRTEEADYGKES